MLNDCKFIGRLVRDPNDPGVYEVKSSGSKEYKLYRNAIAVERNYKDSSGERPVDFIDFTAWDAKADFLKNWAAKGKLILISGRMEVNSKGEGQEYKKYVNINVNDVQIIEWPDKEETTDLYSTGETYSAGGSSDFYEDVPF